MGIDRRFYLGHSSRSTDRAARPGHAATLGMMMLSPMIVSLPFKIMLFVLIDGWSLIMGTLAASFSV